MSNDKEPEGQKGEGAHAHKSTAPPVVTEHVRAKIESEPASDQQTTPTNILRKLSDAIVVWLERPSSEKPKWTDVAIVLLTFALGILAYVQFRDQREGSIQTDRIVAANERLAASNEKFSTAMETSNSQSRTAFEASNKLSAKSLDTTIAANRLEQRAWITAGQASIEPAAVGEPISFSYFIQNTGKTLGKRVNIRAHVAWGNARPWSSVPSHSEIRPAHEIVSTHYPSVGVIAPGVIQRSVRSDTTATQGYVAGVAVGWNYVWGDIWYEDVFGVPHKSTFCSERKGDKGAFTQCGFHNDAN